MASTLTDHLNANGAVGRYGGEEFCVLLPGMTAQDAALVAEQIRLAFGALSTGPESATDGRKRIHHKKGLIRCPPSIDAHL